MAAPEQLRSTLAGLPDAAGVYVFRDAEGEILYVGKAKSLRNRVRSYFGSATASSLKLGRLVPRIAAIETYVTES